MAASRKYRIKYVKAYDFKTSFVTGMHGGLASNGLVNVNFFADRASMPDMENIELGDNNIILKTEESKENDLIRDVQFGCYMDINTTKLLINWLELRVREYENQVKQTL